MAFDQETRNRLARFVSQARSLLTEEFTRQLQHEYGLDPTTGLVAPLDKLTALDDARRETARILRETLSYYLAGQADNKKNRQAALDRILREQAFTVLNRLCALRMAEARGIILPAVGQGYRSQGFQLYAMLAGSALGETGEAYQTFLFSLFDELAVELPPLFDRFSPEGRLFPRPTVLLDLLELMNAPDLEPLWAEDETIGWVYQYFNSKEERQQMRKASTAPRNSRELAVRNQFFTPRYVVEFLTDNTLGRIWYEMTKGETGLVETCRYLVRRPREIFLGNPAISHRESAAWVQAALAGDFTALPEHPPLDEIGQFALLIDGYALSERFGYGDVLAFASRHMQAHVEEGAPLPQNPLELWLILFAYQRGVLRHGVRSTEEEDPILQGIRTAYNALRSALQDPPTADLSQEELLHWPVFIPVRPLKDPRDIKMLDPACGSMHFGLYAFDLYERIYQEAWELEARLGPDAFRRSPGLRPLRETYPDKAALRRDIPRLIIEYNIHGIDIDPRAVQIAGLSLWLRAQKAWQAQGLKPAERPQIRQSNIVCAEPMPGDRAMLEEFLATLDQGHLERLLRLVLNLPPGKRLRVTPAMAEALAGLVRAIWDEMALAGEAGSLLKIEETLREAVAAAREASAEKSPLFKALEYDLGTGDLDFWDHAEDLVLAALQDYAEGAANGQAAAGSPYRRRLFAGDAAQGFAFIQLCRQRYDVALMNPPFGKMQSAVEQYARKEYSRFWTDIYAAFLTRCQSITSQGIVGAITSSLFLYTKQLRALREYWVSSRSLYCLVELGSGVLDNAAVDTALSVSMDRPQANTMFLDLTNSGDKASELLASVLEPEKTFIVQNLQVFQRLYGIPFCYHVDSQKLHLWMIYNTLEPAIGQVVNGNHTFDDTRFLRLRWEVEPSTVGQTWFGYEKGGDYQPFFSPTPLLYKWFANGKEARAFQIGSYGTDAQVIQSISFWFKEGITYPRVSSIGFGPRAMPAGHIFSGESISIFLKDDIDRMAVLGLLCSSWTQDLLYAFGRYRKIENRAVRNLPFDPNLLSKLDTTLGILTNQACKTIMELEIKSEPSPLFVSPFVHTNIHGAREQRLELIYKLQEISDNIDTLVGDALFPESIPSLDSDKRSRLVPKFANRNGNTSKDITFEMLNYGQGACLGRWDIRYATGERQPPPLPDPFAPLPACPPGMLQNEQGLPAAPQDVPPDYPLRISWGGVLVDDPGHSEDIVGRVREALAVIWGERAEAIEAEACGILGVDSLRDYFQKPNLFFDDHLKRYSKSRRYAPIYWPLSTASGAYTLWLYYHRLTDQTLYTCVNDFVDPKLKQVAEDLSRLRQKRTRSRDEEAELARLTDFEAELKDFREELLRVAAFWKPNLNDGVQITAAPLWKLFRHRSWQSRLRETWENLEAGEYDWAHLAYSIWPERVREKCKHDKSLAIAHDLEHLYVEPPQETQKRRGRKKADNIQGELDL